MPKLPGAVGVMPMASRSEAMTRGVTAGVLAAMFAVAVASSGAGNSAAPRQAQRAAGHPVLRLPDDSRPATDRDRGEPGQDHRRSANAGTAANVRVPVARTAVAGRSLLPVRFAVALHEDGDYQISFRADQNPQPVGIGGDIGSPLRPGELVTTLQTAVEAKPVRGQGAGVRIRPDPGGEPNLVPGSPAV